MLSNAYGDMQTASLWLTEEAAQRILEEKGNIYLVWVNCWIEMIETLINHEHFGHLVTNYRNVVYPSKTCI